MPNTVMPWWRVGVLALIGVCGIIIGCFYAAIPAASASVAYEHLHRVASFAFWGALWIAGGAVLLGALTARRVLLSSVLGVYGAFQVFWASMLLAGAPSHGGTGTVGAVLFLQTAGITWLCASAVSGVR